MTKRKNIHYVNNTGEKLEDFFQVLKDAYATGKLPDDYADIFTIKILEKYNQDGSNRMIIGWA